MFGAFQLLQFTAWQCHIRDTSSLCPNSSPCSFPDTGRRLQAVDLSGCCFLSCEPHSPALCIVNTYWWATLDIHETYMRLHRTYICSVANSMRSCGNRNVPRQNRTTHQINPGVQRKEGRRTKSKQVRSKSSVLRSQPQKVCSSQSVLRPTELGSDLILQDKRMRPRQVNSSLSKGKLYLLCSASAVKMT